MSDPTTLTLLINTLLLAGGAALISLPMGLLLALAIHRSNLPGRRVVHGLLILMLFMPPFLQVAGWESALGLQGWICREWWPEQPVAVLAGWRGAVWTQSLVNIPWIVLLLGVALARLPAELEQQASLIGSDWQVLRHVTLPLLRWPLLASALAVFVLAANDITITDIYQIRTLAEEIYTGFALGDSLADVPLRTWPGMLLTTLLVLAALIASRQMLVRLLTDGARQCWHADVRRFAVWIWLPLAGLLLVLVGLPLVSLMYQAGMQVTTVDNVRQRHWSAMKAVELIATSPRRFGEEFAWSFALGQLTSLSVTVLSVLLAWRARASHWTRCCAWTLVLVGLTLPGPLLALALGRLLNQPAVPWLAELYDRSLLLPWITLSVRVFPWAYLLCEAIVWRIPQRTLDLAATLGADRVQALRHVLWPHVGPSLGWLWLVLLALTLGDLSASILAVPPGVTTLAVRVFNLAHYGVADQLAALCLGTIGLFGVLAALTIGFWPRGLTMRGNDA